MMNRTILILGGSILAGLFLGLAIRRARVPAPLDAVESRARMPSKERVHTAMLRAEIRDLDARLAALREVGETIEREKLRLETLSQPPPPLSPEALVRTSLRSMLGESRITISTVLIDWLEKDPTNITVMMKIAGEVFREKDWGRSAAGEVEQFFSYYLGNLQPEELQKLFEFLVRTQGTEPDPLIRGWMLRILDSQRIGLPADQLGELARSFRESKDPRFREAAFPMLLKDAASYPELIRDAVRQGEPEERAHHLLKAWEKRALPGGELRTLARELMKSDDPSVMIQQAQDWVPKYINPLAPQDTVALFDQTLSKPIPPMYKAVSVMVMGSIATLFPSHPGRAEIDRFVASTDDAKLKEFCGKVVSLIDEGKGYAEIRQLNPTQFGIPIPK